MEFHYRPGQAKAFQKAEFPTFQHNLHMNLVSLPALCTGHLYPRKYSWNSFLLQPESNPGPQCGRKYYSHWRIPVTPLGIETVTLRFAAQHLNNCATSVPHPQYRVIIKYMVPNRNAWHRTVLTSIFGIKLVVWDFRTMKLCLWRRFETLKAPTLQFQDVSYKIFETAVLTFRHRASCTRILGQAFHYSPENASCIFNQQIYFIIWYLLDGASLI